VIRPSPGLFAPSTASLPPPAREHDSERIDELMKNERPAVIADIAWIIAACPRWAS
jgi:hypothetical protein